MKNKTSKYDDGARPRDRQWAAWGTVAFIAITLVLLIILGFKTPLPYPEEEGAYVLLGNVEIGAPAQNLSSPEPQHESVQEEPVESQPEEVPVEQPQEEVLTQDVEEAPVIESSKKEPQENKEKQVQPVEENKTQAEESTEKTEEVKEEKKANPLFEFKKSDKQAGQGSGGDEGVQGNPNGNPDASQYGTGSGTGFSFNLSGRGLVKAPPKITGENQKAEKVVIEITVNRQGKVIKAEPTIKGGATLTTGPLVQKAVKAALQMEFTPNPNAFEEQTGTVTFHFKPYK